MNTSSCLKVKVQVVAHWRTFGPCGPWRCERLISEVPGKPAATAVFTLDGLKSCWVYRFPLPLFLAPITATYWWVFRIHVLSAELIEDIYQGSWNLPWFA